MKKKDTKALKKILALIKKNRKEIKVNIPSYWNYPFLNASGKIVKRNLFDLFIEVIEDFIFSNLHQNETKNDSLIIYGAMVRTTTAFDFDNDNILSLENKYGIRETGTILRMILLIPYLKRLGVNTIYLLPIFLNSEKFKKGDAPSLYSIKNYFKIDKYLFDPIIGKYSEKLLNLEFKAFVEASHLAGIKVFIDFIPRTASRDNDLIRVHPEWFYWIKKEYEKLFKAPYVEGLPFTSYYPKFVRKIYSSTQVKEHLMKFTPAPNIININKWNKIKKRKDNILDLVEENFNITTAPGFSDCINDPQPMWKEVTFLRLFLDHPENAKKYLNKEQPPYILFDVIKSSRAPGKIPNKELWNIISDILPYWIKNFSIDGVRIDMAHALPPKLEAQIISKARETNSNLFLIAEELDNLNSRLHKKSGYNAIIGSLWADEPRWQTGNLKKVFNSLSKIKLPILATSETHDTPRAIARENKLFHFFTAVLNYFLPNTIPFINSGFELREIQPMNKGLDSEYCNVYLLPKKDFNYGKLALFDFTYLHWNNNCNDLFTIMSYCNEIRVLYPEITQFNKFKKIKIFNENEYVFGYYYKLYKKNFDYLLFLVNSNMKKNFKIKFFLDFINKIDYIESILNSNLFFKKEIIKDKKIIKNFKINGKYIDYKIKKAEISIIGVKLF